MNLKNLILGAGIVLSSYLPMQKTYSQDNYDKISIQMDIGKDISKFKSKVILSKAHVHGKIDTKFKIFTDFEASINEFDLNDYAKSTWGYKFLAAKKTQLNPIFGAINEVKYIEKNEQPYFKYGLNLGVGAKFDYELNKLKGSAELIFPFSEVNEPWLYNRTSLKTKRGQLELFFKGKNLKDNSLGLKFTTKPFREDFSLFAEYLIRNHPKLYAGRDFFSFGLSISIGGKF